MEFPNNIATLIILGVVLLLLLKLYFVFADRVGIIDKPNERSSHRYITIRGGGIIFPVAAFLWYFFFGYDYIWLISGLLLISTISFVDDIFTLPALPRVVIQLISIGLLLSQLQFFQFHWGWGVLLVILLMGWINAFNFMDGINGITAFYSLISLTTFYFLNHLYDFGNSELLLLLIISVLIFSFFNARRRARTFAGDVGSVSMAFILGFLMLQLILHTGNWEYILFFGVYGVDTVLTIVQRLMRQENIFRAHRSHLYQYLANEKGWSHVQVSLLYAFVQLMINIILVGLLVYYENVATLIFLLLLGSLTIAYILIKGRILRQIKVS